MRAPGTATPWISGHEMPADPEPGKAGKVPLRLFVTDRTPKAVTVFANAKAMLGDRPGRNYTLEVTDVRENPRPSIDEGVVTPLLRQRRRQVVGNLTNREKVLAGPGL